MFARIKIIIWNFIRLIQEILVTILLFLIYVFGFGLTAIFTLVFNRHLLRKGSKNEDTFWNEVKDHEANMEDSLRQS